MYRRVITTVKSGSLVTLPFLEGGGWLPPLLGLCWGSKRGAPAHNPVTPPTASVAAQP